MTDYELMLEQAEKKGISVKEKTLKSDAGGLVFDNKIALNKRKLQTTVQKKCVLAEELAHFDYSVGNITDIELVENRKQELEARILAYNRFIGLIGIIKAYKNCCKSLHDMAEFLEVTEEFLSEALEYYRSKYGVCTKIENYTIYFEPNLGVMELLHSNNK